MQPERNNSLRKLRNEPGLPAFTASGSRTLARPMRWAMMWISLFGIVTAAAIALSVAAMALQHRGDKEPIRTY